MKEIKLTQGKVAVVDDADYQWLTEIGKWQFDRYAYCTRKIGGKRRSIRMHRLIAEKMFLEFGGLEVDHINRNKLDNRRDNLRLVTRSQNIMNQDWESRKISGHNCKPWGRWVYWDKSRRKWKAKVSHVDLGRFDNPEDARDASVEYLREQGWECDAR